jgi:hypothetical protein
VGGGGERRAGEQGRRRGRAAAAPAEQDRFAGPNRVSHWSSLLILGLYFLKVGLQIGFGGFNLQASTGVALR